MSHLVHNTIAQNGAVGGPAYKDFLAHFQIFFASVVQKVLHFFFLIKYFFWTNFLCRFRKSTEKCFSSNFPCHIPFLWSKLCVAKIFPRCAVNFFFYFESHTCPCNQNVIIRKIKRHNGGENHHETQCYEYESHIWAALWKKSGQKRNISQCLLLKGDWIFLLWVFVRASLFTKNSDFRTFQILHHTKIDIFKIDQFGDQSTRLDELNPKMLKLVRFDQPVVRKWSKT